METRRTPTEKLFFNSLTRFLNATDPLVCFGGICRMLRGSRNCRTNSRSFEFVVPTHYLRADPSLSSQQKGTPFGHRKPARQTPRLARGLPRGTARRVLFHRGGTEDALRLNGDRQLLSVCPGDHRQRGDPFGMYAAPSRPSLLVLLICIYIYIDTCLSEVHRVLVTSW